jgi:hypothetical protein
MAESNQQDPSSTEQVLDLVLESLEKVVRVEFPKDAAKYGDLIPVLLTTDFTRTGVHFLDGIGDRDALLESTSRLIQLDQPLVVALAVASWRGTLDSGVRPTDDPRRQEQISILAVTVSGARVSLIPVYRKRFGSRMPTLGPASESSESGGAIVDGIRSQVASSLLAKMAFAQTAAAKRDRAPWN